MFELAAKTWVKENLGKHKIVNINSGNEAIEAMEAYSKDNNGIDGLRYFGHSFEDGLAIHMGDGHASLYSGGAGWLYSFIKPGAARISQIDPSLFDKDATISLHGCNAGKGKDSFAEKLASHLGLEVTAANSGTYFSGKSGGKFSEGLPDPVREDYKGPVYLVPWGGWEIFGK